MHFWAKEYSLPGIPFYEMECPTAYQQTTYVLDSVSQYPCMHVCGTVRRLKWRLLQSLDFTKNAQVCVCKPVMQGWALLYKKIIMTENTSLKKHTHGLRALPFLYMYLKLYQLNACVIWKPTPWCSTPWWFLSHCKQTVLLHQWQQVLASAKVHSPNNTT